MRRFIAGWDNSLTLTSSFDFFSAPPLSEQHAGVALSALIQALDQLDMVAIVRYAYDRRSNPQVGAAFPCVKQHYEVRSRTPAHAAVLRRQCLMATELMHFCLVSRTQQCLKYVQLPFMEDLRHFTFPSLENNKKFTPSGAFVCVSLPHQFFCNTGLMCKNSYQAIASVVL